MAKNRLQRLLAKGPIDIPGPATASPVARKQMEQQERRYRAEDALRCLTRAKEIERDSGLMRDVKTVAKEKLKELQGVVRPSGRQ